LGSTASADPSTYTFQNITTGANYPGIGSQFNVTVANGGASGGFNYVTFTITNSGPLASAITDVYFQDGTLLSLSNPNYTGTSSGVSFSAPATPGNLPGGNSITPNFKTTQEFSEDSNTPITANAVNPGQSLVIQFQLQSGKTFTDTLAALAEGVNHPSAVWDANGNDITGGPSGLRLGIHVQGLPDGSSQSFITSTPSVPEPSSMAIAGLGALGFVAFGLRRRLKK